MKRLSKDQIATAAKLQSSISLAKYELEVTREAFESAISNYNDVLHDVTEWRDAMRMVDPIKCNETTRRAVRRAAARDLRRYRRLSYETARGVLTFEAYRQLAMAILIWA